MPRYCVTVEAKGWLWVEAPSKQDAMRIAESQPTQRVIWDDDWIAVAADEDNGYWGEYIKEDFEEF